MSDAKKEHVSRSRWAVLASFVLGACLNQATRALESTAVEASTTPPQPADVAAPQGVALFDVGIAAKNVGELRAFYEKVGFPVRFGNEKFVLFGLGANDLAIHVADELQILARR